MVTPVVMEATSAVAASSNKADGVMKDDKLGSGESGAVAVEIHPLVVINISDHHTRFTAMQLFPQAAQRNALNGDGDSPETLLDPHGNIRVIGVLLGEQDGRTMEVCHSIEMHAKMNGGRTEIDTDYMQRRIEQYKQIFPRYNVVGWYSTGSFVTDDDRRLHSDVFSVLTESPVLLVINPQDFKEQTEGIRGHHRPGAIIAYQAEFHVAGDELTKLIVQVPHRFASADSERIAVDHVTKNAVGGNDVSSGTVMHLNTLRRSIAMLDSRVKVVIRFLRATAAKEIPHDHDLLRKVYGVCSRLPALNSIRFNEAFDGEKNDATVAMYLGGVTKSLCAMNEVVSKFNLAYEKTSNSDGRRKGPYIV